MFRIHVSKDNLVFAAGHFASYDGDTVEPLHGHNYRVSVTIEGPLDENAYVFNFVTVKRMLKRLADTLDHRMLLPDHNRFVKVEDDGEHGVIARVGSRWYRFPKEDVVVLPIANTTAEELARYLCGLIKTELDVRPDASHLTLIEVEVEETFGQSGIYREQFVDRSRGFTRI